MDKYFMEESNGAWTDAVGDRVEVWSEGTVMGNKRVISKTNE